MTGPCLIRAGAALVLAATLSGCVGGISPTAASTPSRPVTTSTLRVTTTTTRSTVTTTTTIATTTTPPEPVFTSSIRTVTPDELHASWRPGCPVPVESLRAVEVTHWGFDGGAHHGTLIVASDVVEGVVEVVRALFEAGFPIERIEPVDVYDGDDDMSMAANNTSAFNCRPVTGGSGWSQHSYGIAIDVNPLVNPYVSGSTVLPPDGAEFVDRSLEAPGMIHDGDIVVTTFADHGWHWGGYWSSTKDYQHFSTTGR